MRLIFSFWRHIPLRAQVFAGFAVPIVMVVGLSWVVEKSMEDASHLSEEAERSIRSVAVRSELLNTVLDAETGERGFVITGNPLFLEPYQEARADFSKVAQEWRSLEDEPEQPSLDRAEAMFERWLTEVAEPAIAARRQSPGRLFSHGFDALYHLIRLRDQILDDQVSIDAELMLQLEPLREAAQLGSDTDEAQQWQQLATRGQALNDLLDQLRNSPSQPLRAQAYELIEQIVLELRELTHDAREAEDLAAEIVASGRGKLLVNDIRTLIADSIERKEQVHTALAFEARKRMRQVEILALVLPVAGVGLGLAFLLIMQLDTIRGINRLRRGARDIEEGDLSTRVQDNRSDELGDLGKGFNRMAEKLQSTERENRFLDSLQSMLISSNSESEAYAATARALERLLPNVTGALYIMAPSRDFAELVLSWGAKKESPAVIERFNAEDCRALRTGRTHSASTHSAELFCPHTDENQIEFSVCIPLITREDILGNLFIFAESTREEQVNKRLLPLATTVAERLALALSNLRLTEKLRRESLRDPLTGLFNRRYLEETFDREQARVARAGKPMAVIALDVDHFKRFNDEFGHDAGDKVLKELAAKINHVVRSGDIACRFGGEEFVLVLPEAGVDVAEARAEDLRRQIEALDLSYGGKTLGSLTISLGVAVFPQHSRVKDELFKLADEALYAAKRQGRNRVVVSAKG